MATKKFYTTISRYVDGHYVRASVENPALVDIDVDKFPTYHKDKFLTPADSEVAPVAQKLEPPFSSAKKQKSDKKIDRTLAGRQPGEARPSDEDPAAD